MDWSGLASWWRAELESDSAYEEVVTPLLLELLDPRSGALYLDLGCGEGRVMRAVEEGGARVCGLDLNLDLVNGLGSACVARLPDTPVRDSSFDGVYCVLTLEHVQDQLGFFREAARVTKPGGVLALVTNHPTWTAPGSTPVTDDHGEVLWRPGDYFSSSFSEVPAGDTTIVFHHRSMSALLNAAADAGWSLDGMVEQPHHYLSDQAGIPRLLACRWRILSG